MKFKTIKVIDDTATGNRARIKRLAARRSLRATSKRMGISAAMLCDLEYGRRRWSEKHWLNFLKAIQ